MNTVVGTGTSGNRSAARAKAANAPRCRQTRAVRHRVGTFNVRNHRFTVDLSGARPRHLKSEFLSIVLVLIVAILSGCSGQTLGKNLPYLVGKDVPYAISVLGAPTSVSEFGGTQFISWSVNQQSTMILPTSNTSNSTGYVGGTSVYGTTTTSGTMQVPVSAFCTITLHARGGTITTWEWRGNEAGCSQFASRLKGLSK